MKVFLAGTGYLVKGFFDFYRLESYLTAVKNPQKYTKYKDFILDSGLFSYLNGADASAVDWEEYVDKYADFVRENCIKNYVEVDADRLIGLREVERLRERLIKRVGWKPMPVWHINRGYDEWLRECRDFSYVCFGAFLTDGLPEKKYPMIRKFLEDAEKNNCKVHGLGFTSMKYLNKLKFYSVDSSSWTTGNRFGTVYCFDGKKLVSNTRPTGKRIANQKKLGEHNFMEWVKFSQYADLNL